MNTKAKIYIWGTGIFSEKLLHKYFEVKRVIDEVKEVGAIPEILGFFDSDKQKWNCLHHGYMIVEPCIDNVLQAEYIVLALKDDKNVREQLESYKYPSTRIISNNEFNDYLLDIGLNYREEITSHYKTNNIGAKGLPVFAKIVQMTACFDKCEQVEKTYSFPEILYAASWMFKDNCENASQYFGTTYKYDSNRKIRTVGFITDRFYSGGVERTVSILLQMFIDAGYNVVLITNDYKQELEYDYSREVKRYIREKRTYGVTLERLEELENIIKDAKIDLMCFHAGYMEWETYYDIQLCKLNCINTLMELHSAYYAFEMHKELSIFQLSQMLKLNDEVVVLSENDKSKWKQYGVNSVIIPNPVEGHIKNKDAQKNAIDRNTIIWVGRVVEDSKRVLETVSIISYVKEYIPDIKLLIVGRSHNKKDYIKLQNKIKDGNLTENIILCGYKKDISRYYETSEMLLMTSETESFSNVLVEAKSYGLPVVMYDIPWLEIVKNGNGVIKVPQKDARAAAEAIVEIINNQEVRNKLVDEAKRDYQRLCNIDYMKLWSRVIEKMNE